jgi:hypothetical protein
VGGAGVQLTGDEEEDGDIPGEAGLARRQSEMADPAVEATGDEAGGQGGGAARRRRWWRRQIPSRSALIRMEKRQGRGGGSAGS